MTQLGTLEDLPQDYREAMTAAGVAPLWPMMRNVLPHDAPRPVTRPGYWNYDAIRPLLLRAGELTPVEKAERRVLVLSDPGRGAGAMQATASIYLGLQLLLPGETAPAHVHTPSAVRIVVEGKGGYTVVDGEKLPMEEGDLVLTPGGEWHDHGHEGEEPVVWLDALDLPLFYYLEGSYATEGPLQAQRNRPDASQVEYLSAGLAPSRRPGRGSRRYPMMRYPWGRTEAALREMLHRRADRARFRQPRNRRRRAADDGLHRDDDRGGREGRTTPALVFGGLSRCERPGPGQHRRRKLRLRPERHVQRPGVRKDHLRGRGRMLPRPGS